ncbi:MAG: carboxypeptidase regulatory-like domain-containing protein [Bacteroidetes bacterium]|nr:carboxypeptidase regulatory-like domain-containing protein [Bacteroidota bacterium]
MKKKILLSITLLLLIIFSAESCKLITEPDNVPNSTVEEVIVIIKGQVLDSLANSPVSNAVVQAFDDTSSFSAITDADGNYTLAVTIVESQKFTLSAFKEGYSEQSIIVLAVKGRTIDVPVFLLKKPTDSSLKTVNFTGQVIDSLSGQPISNAIVRALAGSSNFAAITDNNGQYLLQVKISQTQEFLVLAFKEGYSEKSITVFATEGRNVEVPIFQLKKPTDSSVKSVFFSGQVIDSIAGAPITNAVVRAIVGTSDFATVTNSEGKYNLEVKISHSQELVIVAFKESYSSKNITVFALEGRNIELPVFQLNKQTQTTVKTIVFSGQVIDSLSGVPLNDVVLRAISDESEFTGITTSDGKFVVEVNFSVPKQFTIKTFKEGYIEKSISVYAVEGRNVELPIFELKKPSDSALKSAHFLGQVIDSISGLPLNDAVVRAINGSSEFAVSTNSQGQYDIEVTFSEPKQFTIIAFKENYIEKSNIAFALDGRNVQVPIFKLVNPEDLQNSLSGLPATINLFVQPVQSIGVRESGAVEAAEIIFEARDSSGVPLDLNHKSMVHFKLVSSPNGGEFLYPDSAKTNNNGQAKVTLNSGTSAGVAQVIAEIYLNGKIIRSKPVLITIHGGLPDAVHFDIAVQQYNVPGLLISGLQNVVTVIVGDKYSNPVRPGTAIYFSSTIGVIEGSALTDNLGVASVILLTADPRLNGLGTVKATTINENSEVIDVQTSVIFSGNAIITTDPANNNFNIPNGGSKAFNFSVKDSNGRPIAAGSSITVSAEGSNINLTGNINVIMPDVISGSTNFTFYISDSNFEEDTPSIINITIKAIINGVSSSTEYLLSGTSN